MANEAIKATLGRNIRERTFKIGKSYTDVCKDCKFSIKNFSNWANGKVMPNITDLSKLASYFRCSVQDLITEGSSMEVVDELYLKFNSLDATDKMMALRIIDGLLADPKYSKEMEKISKKEA